MNDPVSAITIFLAACCAAAAVWLRARRRVSWPCTVETITVLFSGFVSTVFTAEHLVAITAARLNGEWAHRYNHRPPDDVIFIGSFPYDFRYYSMALVAIIVLVQGISNLRNARALSRGNRGARVAALKANGLIVVTLLPLLPCVHHVALLVVPALAAAAIGSVRAVQRRKPVVIRRLAGAAGH